MPKIVVLKGDYAGHAYRPAFGRFHYSCANRCGALVTETPDGDVYADPFGPCPKAKKAVR